MISGIAFASIGVARALRSYFFDGPKQNRLPAVKQTNGGQGVDDGVRMINARVDTAFQSTLDSRRMKAYRDRATTRPVNTFE